MKLSDWIEKPKYTFDNLFDEEVTVHSFEIDCSGLKPPQYKHYFDTYQENQMFDLISKLKNMSKPCIYWFEATNEMQAEELMDVLKEYRKDTKGRTIPAKNNNKNSTCIYVGARRHGLRKKDGFTNIAGRMVIHFGYYEPGSTQGLQLVYWAKGKIKLNVMEVPHEAEPFLNVLEKELARKLKPLCGKH